MFAPYIIRYVLSSLEGAPAVLSALVAMLPADSPAWDARPDADRFTLREVVAHLADWETVCRARIERTVAEDTPLLPNWDEDAAAITGDYARTNPHEMLSLWTTRRAATVAILTALSDADWSRVAERETVGTLSVQEQAFLIIAHDGYHLRQAVEQKDAV